MRNPAGEMPFLDHLEELRFRILRALVALLAGFGIGLWAVQRFRLVTAVKEPIAAYLPDGKLTVLSPTEPILVVLKLAFAAGLVLASPVIIWQAWAFLSPALYEREKKTMVPALFVGLGLFLLGAFFAWVVVIPKALGVLLTIHTDAFSTLITTDKYFGFVLQVLLAMGVSFELPLLLVILTALGIVTPASLGRFRRAAIVLAMVAGAFLSPGGDVFTMGLMTLPILLLYEIGVAGSKLVHRRQLRRESIAGAAALLLLLAWPAAAGAQDPVPGQPPPADTLTGPRRADTAAARRLGLPTAPSRQFGAPDSVERRLLELAGFVVTRYQSDSARMSARDRHVQLQGRALTERSGATLEAEDISYSEMSCDLLATGDPKLFERGTVVVGHRVRYDTCIERGVVQVAFTSFNDAGADWFLRGNLGVDSASARRFAASSEITSCDLPLPHYHFATKEVKWMTSSLMVARPAVLYIRDVPIAWIPFIFQETRPGRRSGILIPQFGFNDIVRPTPGYNRQVTNLGYYWAINQYLDAAARFDWFSRRNTTLSVALQYRWLDRFMTGALDYSRTAQNTGSRSQSIRWNHRQQFGITTSLTGDLNLTSNSRVIRQDAIDPLATTQQLTSSLNLQRRFAWGQANLGGTRRQTLGDDAVTQDFPRFALTPKPLDLGRLATWSPTLNLNHSLTVDARSFIAIPREGVGIDSIEQRPRSRRTTLGINTPLRLGTFNWTNTINVRDEVIERPTQSATRRADPSNPADSVLTTTLRAGTFESGVNWNTGINLPILLSRTWRVVPSLNIVNTTTGDFAIRNQRTGGDWVVQGKRLQYALATSPTFFGFFGGVGPIARIRHSISPSLSWNYSPEARIPEDFARAVATDPDLPLQLTSPATQTLSFALSQNFEAKERTAPGDTLAAQQARKFRLLSINTTSISYDLEQAKQPGRTGWTTQTVGNSFQSDLLPGFSLSVSHDLWEGTVGTEEARFAPFLQSVSAGFGLSAGTFRSIGSFLGLGGPPRERRQAAGDSVAGSWLGDQRASYLQRSMRQSDVLAGARQGFRANVNVTIDRRRPIPDVETPETNSSIGFQTSFSPTRFWGVSWQTMYDVTRKEFQSHQVRLERDLHDWRAGFNLVRSPNGNFVFYFSIHLIDLPDLKFDYNQTTIQR